METNWLARKLVDNRRFKGQNRQKSGNRVDKLKSLTKKKRKYVQKKKLTGAPCEGISKVLLKNMYHQKMWHLHSAGRWSSYVATINKQTGLNKPSSFN